MKRVLALLLLLTVVVPPMQAHAQTARAPHGTRFVYLIRHGIYDYDSTVADDRLGNGLNAQGHEQARLAGERLAKLPVKLARVISSDFLRAAQTADDIGAVLKMPVLRDSLIHECTPTSDRPDYMKNHSADEIALCDGNLAAAWAKYFVPAGGDADTYDVLVCHGNVIRWLASRALGNDPSHWTKLDIANGSITVITVRADGSTRLAVFSDASHIPLADQTWTGRGAGWVPPKAKPGMK